VLGSRSREPVVLLTQPGYLELEGLHLGAQLSDLVKHAPIGRATYVAEEGLRHIVSL
jgi:hypothetical protein